MDVTKRQEPFYWLSEDPIKFLQRDYLLPSETPQSRLREIGDTVAKYHNDPELSDKFYDYVAQKCYSISTPVWTNFGKPYGLPISCFGSLIGDSVESIFDKSAEVAIMCKNGGGTSGAFGEVRGRGTPISNGGGESFGSVHFMEIFDKTASIVSQGSTRRGSFAAYLPVEHSDIKEFLRLHNDDHIIQEMPFGVTVTNDWLKSMEGDGSKEGGDPEKRAIWSRIIQKRFETGYPYIMFIDNANDQAPDAYKKHGKKINASNMCNEIMLSSSSDESFVCCLSSMNVERYDYWKNTDAVQVLTKVLDAVMSEFIEKARNIRFMEAPVKFAEAQRALGIGVLGYHDYLQENNIAFESLEAKLKNAEIFRFIQDKTIEASREMAITLGEPELMKGTGLRNSCLRAIAPTTSSSMILDKTSPSIEPLNSNYFVKDLAKGKWSYRNPRLKRLLTEKDKDTYDVWKSILLHGGSVQHLSFLSEHEKNVFKTFSEIPQSEIITHAIQRQPFIDQGQSLNIRVDPKTPLHEYNELLMMAWKGGLKGLYYHRSSNPAQETARDIMSCGSCEG